jgi:hypothetical protein
MEGKTGVSSAQPRLYSGKESLRKGSSARQLELTAMHRLGVDIGSCGKVPRRSLKNTVAGQPRKISCG